MLSLALLEARRAVRQDQPARVDGGAGTRSGKQAQAAGVYQPWFGQKDHIMSAIPAMIQRACGQQIVRPKELNISGLW